MKLISWNINMPVDDRVTAQMEALKRLKPDIVALQEVNIRSVSDFSTALANMGLKYCQNSYNLCLSNLGALKGPRARGLLIASRWPQYPLDPEAFIMDWKERVVSVIVESPFGEIELNTAHIPPGSSNGVIKIETINGIYKRLACTSDGYRILCGDFNLPQDELKDGSVTVWGEKRKANGEIVTIPGEQYWVDAERSIITGLGEHDLKDVYRHLYGYKKEAYSYWVIRKEQVVSSRRYDHIFASASLNAVACRYIKNVVENRLSDHAAIEAEFAPV